MKQLHWSTTEKIRSKIRIYQVENLMIKSRCLHYLLEVCIFCSLYFLLLYVNLLPIVYSVCVCFFMHVCPEPLFNSVSIGMEHLIDT